MLHVYEGEPDEFVGKKRAWLKELRNYGPGKFDVKLGDDNSSTFRNTLSNALDDLQLHVEVTNRVLEQGTEIGRANYYCVLTRIDSFTALLGDFSWNETSNRAGLESDPGDWRRLQELVGTNIMFSTRVKKKVAQKAEDVSPSGNELEEESLDSENAESGGDA